jgi:HSP20 family protein
MKNLFKSFSGINRKSKKFSEDEENLKDMINNELDNQKMIENDENGWIADEYEEGQLSIDVYQTQKELIVKSTIAGVKPNDIDISINNDMLTIRGKRTMNEEINEENYLYRECYWGSFSRSIILPIEVKADKIDASLENGVLTVILPKAKTNKQVSIKVKEK